MYLFTTCTCLLGMQMVEETARDARAQQEKFPNVADNPDLEVSVSHHCSIQMTVPLLSGCVSRFNCRILR